jgi:hypothetical protein
MKRLSVFLSCALLGLVPTACGPDVNPPEPEVRTENAPAVDFAGLSISVSGRIALLPEAAQLLAAQGQPLPTLAGLPLTVEEPLRVLLNDPTARFGTSPLAEDGAFRVDDVPVSEVHLGLAAGLDHPGFARTTSVLFDSAVTGTRPRTDLINSRAWVVPLAFHDALSRAVGEPRLRALSEGRAATLQEAGYVLGRVVDAQGRPVSGARVAPDREDLAGRVLYLSEDLTSVNEGGTSPNGLFLLVYSGADALAFKLGVEGQPDYRWRNVGAVPGVGLVLTLYPGRLPPP